MSFQDLSLDIQSFIRTATLLATIFAVINIWRGIRLLRNREASPYFRFRQQQLSRSWRNLFFGAFLFIFAAWLFFLGEESAYKIFPVTNTPSPSATHVPSMTSTIEATVTPTPSITQTLQFTYTASPSPIPVLPQSISALFVSEVTPNPNTLFSPLVFSKGLNLETYNTSDEAILFQNPVNQIFVTFSYDQMLSGVQWTVLWYRQGELVNIESILWDGATGGLGFAEWAPDAEEWLPGSYQVQIFVGQQVVVVGDFVVEGEALTSTSTMTATETHTATFTATLSPTMTATHTRFPTDTNIP